MRLSCERCDARSRDIPEVSRLEWTCSYCMTTQVYEEEFIDDVVEFEPYFELDKTGE